ncbi:unnamed protein product [Paramecium sonneborni]|uniref:Uncharacterized protein n=1 Tax=Paramecium sonneborni TaxID=65129 RepID=A0A8S1MZ73_9CILI|nr:unnamed protein product [Paramecium sonneborni]
MFVKQSYLTTRLTTQFDEQSVMEIRESSKKKHYRTITSTSLNQAKRPFIHTRSIPKSLIDEGFRSKSIIYHMSLLSNEVKIKIRPSRRERERTILFTDNMELYHHKSIKRIKEMSRRKSCSCNGCGAKTKFEKKHDDFEARTQQAISSDLKLLQFTRAGQKKKQTIIKEFKMRQINERKCKLSQEPTNHSQIQLNLPSTKRDSLQIEKQEIETNRLKTKADLLRMLPSIKSIVSLTVLKQLYIGGRQQHQMSSRKPSHDQLIIKTYRIKS